LRFVNARWLNEPQEPFRSERAESEQTPLRLIPAAIDITEPRKRLHDDCFELGRKTGRESGRKDPQEHTLKVLEATAQSMAETLCSRISTFREQFIQSVLRRFQDRLERLVEAKDVAIADLRDRKSELRDLGERTACPAVSQKLTRGATLGLALSLAPSVHDL